MTHYHNEHNTPEFRNACDIWAGLFILMSSAAPGEMPQAKARTLETTKEVMDANYKMISILLNTGVSKTDIITAVPEAACCFERAVA